MFLYFIVASNVKIRHELLEGAIGVFPEEEIAYIKLKYLSWLLPSVVIAGALLDMILVIVYMRFASPWKNIIFPEEDDREENVPDNNSLQNNESNLSQTKVTIEEILENVQKEILSRKALREQEHRAILGEDEAFSKPPENAGSDESKALDEDSFFHKGIEKIAGQMAAQILVNVWKDMFDNEMLHKH